MNWFGTYLSTIYSILRTYAKIAFSILNYFIIPHEAIINLNANYRDPPFENTRNLPVALKCTIYSYPEKDHLLEQTKNEKDAIERSPTDIDFLYKKHQVLDRISTEQISSYDQTSKKTSQLEENWNNHKIIRPNITQKLSTNKFIDNGEANIAHCDQELKLDESPTQQITNLKKSSEQIIDTLNNKPIDERLKQYVKLLKKLQLREIEERFQIIKEKATIELDILRLQLQQEQLKTTKAQIDLEVQKHRSAIYFNFKRMVMETNMTEQLLKQKLECCT